MDLRNADCLEEMKTLEKESIDLLFADLPYGETNCKWDCLIDLDAFWKEANRVCKKDAPMIFTCSTKFGNTLINSNRKNFRTDFVWVKSVPSNFLLAKKMPMKKHELIYVFYRKHPSVYTENIALHHKHKFKKEENLKVRGESNSTKEQVFDNEYLNKKVRYKNEASNLYDPPLPVSVVKEEENTNKNSVLFGKLKGNGYSSQERKANVYNPPLPTSVVKEECYNECDHASSKSVEGYGKDGTQTLYEPSLPTSVVKEEENSNKNSVLFGALKDNGYYKQRKSGETTAYEPSLPTSILEVKSQRGFHSTQKPVALIEWCLKYYSRENDLVLDPTMGSGSTGIACSNMNRRFIGIEKDTEIFKVAVERTSE